MRVSIRVRVTGAPNNSFKRRPLRVYEIGAFLKVRIGLNVIAIYRWRPRLTPPLDAHHQQLSPPSAIIESLSLPVNRCRYVVCQFINLLTPILTFASLNVSAGSW